MCSLLGVVTIGAVQTCFNYLLADVNCSATVEDIKDVYLGALDA